MTSGKNRGYSLLEMMIVLAIIIILSSFAVFRMQTVLNQQHLDTAYDTTLSTLRNARYQAIAQSHEYVVTFNPAGTIQVLWQPPLPPAPAPQVCPAVQVASNYTLPADITYAVRVGFPNAAATVPDGFGVGAQAIDFGYLPTGGLGGLNAIAFMPDGSARISAADTCTGLENYNSGVIYLTRAAGTIFDSRAITVWGTTGRIRGWRLDSTGGGTWMQQ